MSPKKPTKPRSVKRKVTPKAAPAPKKKAPTFHLHARNPMQSAYVEAIRKNDLTFGIGPAGTGKTFLAVALAVEALKAGVVSKLVLVRPAVEAGERLGFLPGSFQEKVDPYMRPIYDALHEIIGPAETEGLINSGVIEIAPLAFMRGRTLKHSFVIMDEAQNTTSEQMLMLLTRFGKGFKAVVNGDLKQIDLPNKAKSGLIEARKKLANLDGIEFVFFTDTDVVRHPIVQKIVQAYEEEE